MAGGHFSSTKVEGSKRELSILVFSWTKTNRHVIFWGDIIL